MPRKNLGPALPKSRAGQRGRMGPVAAHNYFAPLRIVGHHSSRWITVISSNPVPNTVGRPPPIMIIASINLFKFQGELKLFMKNIFEFRTTRNMINVVTKDTDDYSALMRHFNAPKFPYCNFHLNH